jgi:hypothetical protein
MLKSLGIRGESKSVDALEASTAQVRQFIRAYMKIGLMALLTYCLIFPPAAALADGNPDNDWTAPKEPRAAATPNTASDASFDKRLPPVLPGEIVSDNGRKMRVWSTAGPVPVASAPEPWKQDLGHLSPNGIGVIVDQRKDVSHPYKGPNSQPENK